MRTVADVFCRLGLLRYKVGPQANNLRTPEEVANRCLLIQARRSAFLGPGSSGTEPFWPRGDRTGSR
jgi:hypothetical protein